MDWVEELKLKHKTTCKYCGVPFQYHRKNSECERREKEDNDNKRLEEREREMTILLQSTIESNIKVERLLTEILSVLKAHLTTDTHPIQEQK